MLSVSLGDKLTTTLNATNSANERNMLEFHQSQFLGKSNKTLFGSSGIYS
jgi:hypothetical protein